jgi:hypothetical protein
VEVPAALRPLDPRNTCWCDSGRSHGDCHGDWSRISEPGAPVPDGEDDDVWLTPTTVTKLAVLVNSMGRDRPQLVVPPDRPAPRPLRVDARTVDLARAAAPDIASPRESGRRRFEILDEYGLGDATLVKAQVDALPEDALGEVAARLALESRAAVSRLLRSAESDSPPTTRWSDEAHAGLVGQTLLWADHYLVPDGVTASVLQGDVSRDALERHFARQARLRPLIEAGIVVPVPTELAVLYAADAILQETHADLSRADVVMWLRDQVVVEGPTAREALFFHPRDDFDTGDFELLARVEPATIDDARGSVAMRLLQPYDPTHDYAPWIRQQTDKYISGLAQAINTEIASAAAFRATYITRRPLRARYAAIKSDVAGPGSLLPYLNVPALSSAEPRILAELAQNEDVVATLRAEVRTTFSLVRSASVDEQIGELQGRVNELTREAQDQLATRIRHERIFGAGVPAALSLGSVLVMGATPLGLFAAALAAGASLAPYKTTVDARRREPAYAFWRSNGR